MERMGVNLGRRRWRRGLTREELGGRGGIPKPYLSLIETGRVMNPPSDEKLRRLEQALAFKAGELLTQAHLQRTPRDVRAVLNRLMKSEGSGFRVGGSGKNGGENGESAAGVNLDDAYLSGVLQEMVEQSA